MLAFMVKRPSAAQWLQHTWREEPRSPTFLTAWHHQRGSAALQATEDPQPWHPSGEEC